MKIIEKVLRKVFPKTVSTIELVAYQQGSDMMAWNIVQDTKRSTITVWEDETGVYRLGVID